MKHTKGNIYELSDFTKAQLIEIEYYNRCYCDLSEIRRMNKDELIGCILNDEYCIDDDETLRDATEDEIIDYVIRNEIVTI